MANNYLNVTFASPETVTQLNSDILFDNTKSFENLQDLANFISGLEAGTKSGPVTVSITVRSTDPAVTANGGGHTCSFNIG